MVWYFLAIFKYFFYSLIYILLYFFLIIFFIYLFFSYKQMWHVTAILFEMIYYSAFLYCQNVLFNVEGATRLQPPSDHK